MAGLPLLGIAVLACAKTPQQIEFSKALKLHREHRYELALERYKRLLDRDPTLDGVMCNMAAILLKQNRTEEAATYYRRALRLNPRNVFARYLLAVSFWRAGMPGYVRIQLDIARRHLRELLNQVRTRHGLPEIARLPDRHVAAPAFAEHLDGLKRALERDTVADRWRNFVFAWLVTEPKSQ